jgi:hypothetical protein
MKDGVFCPLTSVVLEPPFTETLTTESFVVQYTLVASKAIGPAGTKPEDRVVGPPPAREIFMIDPLPLQYTLVSSTAMPEAMNWHDASVTKQPAIVQLAVDGGVAEQMVVQPLEPPAAKAETEPKEYVAHVEDDPPLPPPPPEFPAVPTTPPEFAVPPVPL